MVHNVIFLYSRSELSCYRGIGIVYWDIAVRTLLITEYAREPISNKTIRFIKYS